ncbi:MAG: plastocyanin/azurin family copper-binding protein, partial [Kibdelosporangium sp.]
MFRRILAGGVARRAAAAVLGAALVTSLSAVLPASASPPPVSPPVQAAAQTLNWTAGNDITHYTSAPTTAVAGETTIVWENSEATGNTTGMPHTLTFDTGTPGYNTDVSLNILANPFDANNGRHQATVTLTPGKYRYFCSIPGHSSMVGEFTVLPGGPDTTPPTVTPTVTGDKDPQGNYIGWATVARAATDDSSGVDTVEYQIDDQSFLPYSTPVQVTAIGDHAVQYRATDKAGNMSAVGSVQFSVVEAPSDTTPPTVTPTVTGDKDPQGNYIGSATVALTSTDAGSGVKSTEYSLDDAAFTAYTAPVVVNTVGAHNVRYRATDNAGNVSPVGTASFTVVAPPSDTTPPTVTSVVSGDKDQQGNYVEYALVTITASDSGSGVKSTEYKLDDGAWTVYSEPVMVNARGMHMLHYRATDNAGNVSPEGMEHFTVVDPPVQDTTPPTVTSAVTGDKDNQGNYIGSATVTITASDAQSGVDKVEYSVDNGA